MNGQVLLVRAGALGDLLLLRRAISSLQSAGSAVSLLAPSAGRVLLGDGPGEVHRLIDWESAATTRFLAGEAANGPLADELAQVGAVVAYTRSTAVADALRRHASRVLVHDPSPPPGVHASGWLASALEPLGVEAAPELPPLRFSDVERAAAAALVAALPDRFLAIHPGSGSPAKNWPAERFAVLAARLTAGRRWVLVLGPAEHDSALAAAPGAVIARELQPRVLGAVLSRAGLFVGNDSGASHLAAASGAPVLALFGPTDPAQWAPIGRCVRCLRTRDLLSLDVDAVERAARELLATSAASGPPSG